MKKILIAFLFLIVGINLKAQTHVLTYDTCSKLQALNGEWMYNNGADTIRVYLRYHRDFTVWFNGIQDRLWGWHEYKIGNTIIESNYQNRFQSLPYESDNLSLNFYSIDLWLWRGCSDTTRQLRGNITDYHKGNYGHTIQATLNATKTTMTWHQQRSEGHFNDPFTGMTLPANFVLIRQ
jgi:hypothetical protein